MSEKSEAEKLLSELVELQAMGLPGWSLRNGRHVVCSYCAAFAENAEDIRHDDECPIARATTWLAAVSLTPSESPEIDSLTLIERRCAKAMPGVWERMGNTVSINDKHTLVFLGDIETADFIAHSKRDVEALTQEVRAYRRLMDAFDLDQDKVDVLLNRFKRESQTR